MPRVAVVTGANKGIGFEIVKHLVNSETQDVVYLTSRDEGRGRVAVDALKSEGVDASFHQLDLESQESVDRFASHLKTNHGGLDVLVNNAGIAYKRDSTAPFDEQARVTMDTNFFGTLRVCEALVPLVRDGGRVVHVSSQVGHMAFGKLAPDLQNQFDSKNLTKNDLVSLITSFVAEAQTDSHLAKGWPNTAYGVSKIGVTALAGVQQREYDRVHPGNDVIFSACCPGFCDTDMTSHKGPRPAKEGADVAFYLATLPAKSSVARGTFWYDRKELPWKRG